MAHVRYFLVFTGKAYMDTTPRQQHMRNKDYYLLLFLVVKEAQKHTAWRETLKLPGHSADTRHHSTFSQEDGVCLVDAKLLSPFA